MFSINYKNSEFIVELGCHHVSEMETKTNHNNNKQRKHSQWPAIIGRLNLKLSTKCTLHTVTELPRKSFITIAMPEINNSVGCCSLISLVHNFKFRTTDTLQIRV